MVLIPGAWLGSWAWASVAANLRARGHDVFAVTLPGLAERSAGAESFGLSDHVHDVLRLLEEHDLRDAVIVGHSYAGLVAGMVADQAIDRVAQVVFVDANLPEDGRSLIDSWSENGQRIVREDIAANGGVWPVFDTAELLENDLSDAQAEWLIAHATPHPGGTLLDSAALSRPLEKLNAVYIQCIQPDPGPRKELEPFADHWKIVELNTGHWPMVSAPDTLAELLHILAPANR